MLFGRGSKNNDNQLRTPKGATPLSENEMRNISGGVPYNDERFMGQRLEQNLERIEKKRQQREFNHSNNVNEDFSRSSFGNSGFGNSGFGNSSFGNSSFGNSGFGKNSFGEEFNSKQGFGSSIQGSFGNSGFGHANSYGNQQPMAVCVEGNFAILLNQDGSLTVTHVSSVGDISGLRQVSRNEVINQLTKYIISSLNNINEKSEAFLVVNAYGKQHRIGYKSSSVEVIIELIRLKNKILYILGEDLHRIEFIL